MKHNRAHDCEGCSACCESIGCPPLLLESDNGVPHPVGGADAEAGHRRLLDAPVEARAAYVEISGTVNRPCAWLDTVNSRSRYYDFRPDICRTFGVGNEWCSQIRELHQISSYHAKKTRGPGGRLSYDNWRMSGDD